MINQSKPPASTDSYLNVGGGFRFLINGAFRLIAGKGGGAFTNISKVVNYETWDSNTTTWDTETRLWEDMISTWDNESIQGQLLWSGKFLPWRATAPWQNAASGITNFDKP